MCWRVHLFHGMERLAATAGCSAMTAARGVLFLAAAVCLPTPAGLWMVATRAAAGHDAHVWVCLAWVSGVGVWLSWVQEQR